MEQHNNTEKSYSMRSRVVLSNVLLCANAATVKTERQGFQGLEIRATIGCSILRKNGLMGASNDLTHSPCAFIWV